MATTEERIKSLELKIAKAKAQIKKIKEPEQKLNRKQNERRKYLVGAYYMNLYNQDDNAKQKITSAMDDFLTRESDRKLFGLETKKANES